jgi:uncharacterized protein
MSYERIEHSNEITNKLDLFAMGLECATGRAGKLDLVSAHKWFNIAAVRGDREAVRMRAEVACEMSPMEIAAAQRAAREWLSVH